MSFPATPAAFAHELRHLAQRLDACDFVATNDAADVVRAAGKLIEKLDVTLDRWEPDNGTRYDLCLVPLAHGLRMLCWPNGPRGGRCVILQPDGYISADYLEEKLEARNEADLDAVLAWLGTQGYEVSS